MKKPKPTFSQSVFINCPFDDKYYPLFLAVVFTVHLLGFLPRCSMEINDKGDGRLKKIMGLMLKCKYGIHDISRIQRTGTMPRFNMPFELGLDMGFRHAGNKQCRSKNLLILETEPHRYEQFMSDFKGCDVEAHHDRADQVIPIVRDWLNDDIRGTRRYPLPGDDLVLAEYRKFRRRLPELCKELRVSRPNKLSFNDYSYLCAEFIAARHAQEIKP
jgi:hypothetical protein